MMRKIKLTVLAGLLVIGSLSVQAQTDKMNIAKVNIFSPFLGSMSLAYERVITDKLSVQGTFFYIGRRDNKEINGGAGFMVETRFYLSDNNSAPLGVFIAPYLGYGGYKQSVDRIVNEIAIREKVSLGQFQIGLMAGYQWIFKDIITLDVWGGPGFGIGKQSPDYEVKPPFPFTRRTGLTGRLGVTLGIAF